jgi:hypothetical protein
MMCDWQVKVAGRDQDDRGSPCDMARVFVVPTEDGRYEIGLGAADQAHGPAHAVVMVSGPGHCLTRVVRDHSQRLFGLDAIRLLERLSRHGLVVAWPHQNDDAGNNGPTVYTMPTAEKAGG